MHLCSVFVHMIICVWLTASCKTESLWERHDSALQMSLSSALQMSLSSALQMLLSACETGITQPYKCHCHQPYKCYWHHSALHMSLSACERGITQPYKCHCQPVRDVWFSLINVTVSLWEACFSLTNVTVILWEMYDSALQTSLSACERHVSALQMLLSACEWCMIQPYKSHCLLVRVAWLSLTKVTGIVDEDDLMDEVGWRPLQDSMDSPQEGWECFIVETDDDAGSGQVRFICLTVTPAHTHRNRGRCWQWASQIHIYMSYCATCRNKLSTQT